MIRDALSLVYVLSLATQHNFVTPVFFKQIVKKFILQRKKEAEANKDKSFIHYYYLC